MRSSPVGAIDVPSIGAIWRTITTHRPLIMSVVVLSWSISEFANLAVRHNTGPELYGVLTAALSTAAAAANIVLLRSSRLQIVVTAAVMLLWAVVAFGGIAGTKNYRRPL